MLYKYLDGVLFKELVLSGYNKLISEMQYINDLNVFPVPDGDTGTNMKKTLENGINYVNKLNDLSSIGIVSNSLSSGMLFGARGNSGVILSQYFKGISNYLENHTKCDVFDMVNAFISGYKVAYNAVISPTEGTILTVARESIDLVKDSINKNSTINDLVKLMIKQMKISLEETPEKLDVLKEAGVVDSGGAGLLSIFEGMLNYLEDRSDLTSIKEVNNHDVNSINFDPSLFNENSELTYGYCTEFILQLLNSKCDVSKVDINEFISYYSTLGDSIVAIKNDSIIKIHVHTKTPAKVIDFAQKYGEFITFKMENMSIQNNEVKARKKIVKKKKIHKKTAFVVVGQGDGIIDLFYSLNADVVLNGGQTMNTSCEEFISAFDTLDAENIIVLPNNKNIVLAANQAKELYKKANVYIIPTKSIAEGYFALSSMINPNEDISYQLEAMGGELGQDLTGYITYSTRESNLNGIHCDKNDYIGILNGNIVSSSKDEDEAFLSLINKIEGLDDKEIIVIFVGQHGSKEKANKIGEYIKSKNSFVDIGIIDGKQDIYDYIIGIY